MLLTRILCSVLVLSVIMASSVVASVEFVAEPPTGSTGFGNSVSWSLANQADPGQHSFDVTLGSGLSGSAVVTAMKGDMDSFANPFGGANSVVDGNSLVVANATWGWYSASPEVGLSMNKSGTDGGISHLDLPLGIEQREYDWLVVLIVEDLVDPSRPAGSDGSLLVAVMLDATPLTATVEFGENDTPGVILRNLNTALGDLPMPARATYAGLVDGFPTILLSEDMEVALALSVSNPDQVGFHVGGLFAPPIPEPASLSLLGATALTLLVRRRRA